MAERAARSVLGAVRAVTYTAPDLRAIETAYSEELGYVVAARGRVPGAQARAWGAPAVEGWPMLTLRPAFDESDRGRLIRWITHYEPPGPRKLDRRIPRDLETVVLKAVAKEPKKRAPGAPDALAVFDGLWITEGRRATLPRRRDR